MSVFVYYEISIFLRQSLSLASVTILVFPSAGISFDKTCCGVMNPQPVKVVSSFLESWWLND